MDILPLAIVYPSFRKEVRQTCDGCVMKRIYCRLKFKRYSFLEYLFRKCDITDMLLEVTRLTLLCLFKLPDRGTALRKKNAGRKAEKVLGN